MLDRFYLACQQTAMDDLVVCHTYKIAGRGTAVFFDPDPEPWLPWCAHNVIVNRSDGCQIKAIAHVEFARKVPPGEVMALLFPDLEESDIPIGSRITVVGPVEERSD